MSVIIVSIIAAVILLIAAKSYFQHKKNEDLKEAIPTAKSPEQVVYERLQEIAKFEEEDIKVEKVKLNSEPVFPVAETEKKPKQRKHKSFRKYKPRTKSK